MTNLINDIDLHILSCLILTVMIISIFSRGRVGTKQEKLFIVLIFTVIFSIVTAMFSHFGIPQTDFFVYWGNGLSYIFTPAIAFVWLLYVFSVVNKDSKTFALFGIILSIPILINTVLVVVNPTGLYFTVNSNHEFARGPLYFMLVGMASSYMLASVFISLKYGQKTGVGYTKYLLLFIVFPAMGLIFQTIFYGTFFLWLSLTLAVFFIFINVQNRIINIDYLTNAYNRRYIELILTNKIENKSRNFYGFMMDLDYFKLINDNFGHHSGDEALIETVKILKKVFGKKGYVGRFGGDEFLVITHEVEEIDARLSELEKYVDKFNQRGKKYRIGFSIGGCLYENSSNISAEEYLNILDKKMYSTKKKKHFNRRSEDHT